MRVREVLSYDGGVRGRWVANLINAGQRDTLVHGAVAGNDFGWSLAAIAESVRDPGDAQRAEYALAATDPWQNMGIGTLLTRHVARIAVSRGFGFGKHTCLWTTRAWLGSRMVSASAVNREVDIGVVTTVHELML